MLPDTLAGLPQWLSTLLAALGNKNLALSLSAAIALATLAWQQRTDHRELAGAVQAAEM